MTRYTYGFAAIVIACLVLFSACPREKASDGPGESETLAEVRTVRLGYLPITADISFFVGLERGYFRQEGLEVEAVRFTSANQAMNALISGHIDGAIMIGYSTLITIYSKNTDVCRIVQSGVETEDKFTARILVPPDSPVQKVEELKGMTIGTYSGATQKLNLLLVLSHFFETPHQDVSIVQVESNLQLPSLSSGRFDALFTIDPYATVAIEQNLGRSICDSPRAKYIVNPFPTCATVLSTEFLESHTGEATKVVAALQAATEWAVANTKEAAIIIANPKYTDVSEEIALKAGTYEWWNLGEHVLDPIQELADIMYEKGLIDSEVSVEGMFADTSVLSSML